MIYKIFWFIRALLFKPFFKSFGMPSYLGKPVFLEGINRAVIGKRVRIFPGLRLEVIGKHAEIVISDDVAIAQNVHITSAGKLFVGKSVTILANVFITNIDHAYEDINRPASKQELIIKDTSIGENCFIGIGASIQAGTTLGKHCIVGTNAVVRGTFPDYCVIAGVPARIIKKYDTDQKKWVKVNF
jgi:acetyltransferase-like isoleucine patch superfamily enzyme